MPAVAHDLRDQTEDIARRSGEASVVEQPYSVRAKPKESSSVYVGPFLDDAVADGLPSAEFGLHAMQICLSQAAPVVLPASMPFAQRDVPARTASGRLILTCHWPDSSSKPPHHDR